MSEKKSWRDVIKIHPAAEIFPLIPEDERRSLGEDIKKNDLKEQVVLWSEKANDLENAMLLDGRNRLDAMEFVGMETVQLVGKEWRLKMAPRYLSLEPNSFFPDTGGVNPFSYSISKNFHRRHMTKEMRADLIVQAIKLEREFQISQTMAKPETRQFPGGTQGGSTPDPFKAEVVAEAKKQGISQRTAERAIAKANGPVQEPRAPVHTPRQSIPRTDLNNVALHYVARDAIVFLEPKFRNLAPFEKAQILTAIAKHFELTEVEEFVL